MMASLRWVSDDIVPASTPAYVPSTIHSVSCDYCLLIRCVVSREVSSWPSIVRQGMLGKIFDWRKITDLQRCNIDCAVVGAKPGEQQ